MNTQPHMSMLAQAQIYKPHEEIRGRLPIGMDKGMALDMRHSTLRGHHLWPLLAHCKLVHIACALSQLLTDLQQQKPYEAWQLKS